MSDQPNPPPAPPQPVAAGPPLYALVTAGALLLLYVILTLAMLFNQDLQGERWEHALLVYNGFQAFAAAAGGVLLGTGIQQVNLATARRDTQEAKAESKRVKEAVREALAATASPLKSDATDVEQLRVQLSKAL